MAISFPANTNHSTIAGHKPSRTLVIIQPWPLSWRGPGLSCFGRGAPLPESRQCYRNSVNDLDFYTESSTVRSKTVWKTSRLPAILRSLEWRGMKGANGTAVLSTALCLQQVRSLTNADSKQSWQAFFRQFACWSYSSQKEKKKKEFFSPSATISAFTSQQRPGNSWFQQLLSWARQSYISRLFHKTLLADE